MTPQLEFSGFLLFEIMNLFLVAFLALRKSEFLWFLPFLGNHETNRHSGISISSVFNGEIILFFKKKKNKPQRFIMVIFSLDFFSLIIWKLTAPTVHPLWIQYFPADGKLCDIQILYKDLIVHSDLRCQKDQSGNSANSFILLKILSQCMARYPQCDILQPRPLLLAPTATTWQTSTAAPSFCSSSSQIICLHESRSLGPLTSTSWKRSFQTYQHLTEMERDPNELVT